MSIACPNCKTVDLKQNTCKSCGQSFLEDYLHGYWRGYRQGTCSVLVTEVTSEAIAKVWSKIYKVDFEAYRKHNQAVETANNAVDAFKEKLKKD